MDLRTHYPYSLLRYGLIKTYPSLKKDIKTDVAIIGGGITGALAAYHLQKEGIHCVVADKRHVATGSTAASTSLIQYETDVPLHRLASKIGYENAVRSYELCRHAIYDLKTLCLEIGSENIFQERYSLQFASFKKHVKGLEMEYALRKKHGFDVEFLTNKQLSKQFHFSKPAALLSKEAAEVDAYQLAHSIFQFLQCPVYDHTEIVSVRHEKKRVMLKTSEGFTITANKLVVACGYESGRYLKRKLEELRCTFAIISEPIPKKQLWKYNCLIWETADPYLYLRTTPGNRIVIGGKDTKYMNLDKQLALLPQKATALKKAFQKLFPALPFKIDFQWAGTFSTTKDGLPFIGTVPEVPDTYFALGYGGNGITFSLIAAQMITRAIKGKKSPDQQIFSLDR